MRIHINTNAPGVVSLKPCSEVFSKPDPQRRVVAEVEWGLVVGEDQLSVVQGVCCREVIPQSMVTSVTRFEELLGRVDDVVGNVGDDDIQRIPVWKSSQITILSLYILLAGPSRKILKLLLKIAKKKPEAAEILCLYLKSSQKGNLNFF